MRIGRRSFVGVLGALAGGCSASRSASEADAQSLPLKKGIASAGRKIASDATPALSPKKLAKLLRRLVPIHEKTTAPKPGEWRFDHPEPGQSFEEYLGSSPTLPTSERRSLVVQPLGNLPKGGARIVELATDFLGRQFNLPVRGLDRLELARPPLWAHRQREGGEQLLTQWLLKDVLPARLPSDAMALVAFVETDLWPGEGWNFVFGEATLSDRVGVWSLHRYGDPDASPAAFKLALRRALKIAAHETGHMFSLHHCTAYRCLQSGVNSLEEADASPLWLCPDCLAKIAWATQTDPREHLRKVHDFCKAQGLDDEAAFFSKSLSLLA